MAQLHKGSNAEDEEQDQEVEALETQQRKRHHEENTDDQEEEQTRNRHRYHKSHVPLPSDEDIEKILLERRKQEILKKYLS